jgi:hypothetical protein
LNLNNSSIECMMFMLSVYVGMITRVLLMRCLAVF